MSKKTVSVVGRMIECKKKLIARLEADIAEVHLDAKNRIRRIEFNIRRAKVILSALEKGSLKP